MTEQEVLRITDAARILNVSRFTVARLARDGTIPTIIVGKRRMIPKAELLDWIKRNTLTP